MSPSLAGSMAASAAVVAALAGVVQLGRWRLTRETPAPWLAAGLFVYSGAALAVPAVAVLVSPEAASAAPGPAVLRPVAVPVVIALFAAATIARAGGGVRQTLVLGGCTGVVAVAAAAGAAVEPTVRSIFGPSLVSAPEPGAAAVGQLVVAAAWWGLAAALGWRAQRLGDVGRWVPVMLVALGASRVSLTLAAGSAAVFVIVSQAFRAAAVGAALAGALLGLQSLIVALRQELLAAKVEVGREHTQVELMEAEDGTRRHELRNGLAAIGGTAWLLEHHEPGLDDGTRVQLIRGVTGEVRRLQQLLERSRTEEER